MIDQDKKIKKAMPRRRDPACFELRHAILIPAGTILRETEPGIFSAPTAGGAFTVENDAAMERKETYKRVIA